MDAAQAHDRAADLPGQNLHNQNAHMAQAAVHRERAAEQNAQASIHYSNFHDALRASAMAHVSHNNARTSPDHGLAASAHLDTAGAHRDAAKAHNAAADAHNDAPRAIEKDPSIHHRKASSMKKHHLGEAVRHASKATKHADVVVHYDTRVNSHLQSAARHAPDAGHNVNHHTAQSLAAATRSHDKAVAAQNHANHSRIQSICRLLIISIIDEYLADLYCNSCTRGSIINKCVVSTQELE